MAEKKENLSELVYIQSRLKAPKSQKNTFAGYMFRNCEDILEAVKPLLKETNCSLIISDDIVQVGDRIYVKATATLDTPSGKTYQNTAFARESLTKKGLDDSQVTGAASSYARKYALNGLFCIDDTKDADTLNNNPGYMQQQPVQQTKDAELEEAFQMIRPNIENAPSRQYLNDLHVQNVALHQYPPYRDAMNKRVNELERKK